MTAWDDAAAVLQSTGLLTPPEAFAAAGALIAAGYVQAPTEYAVTSEVETGIYVSRQHAEDALDRLTVSDPGREYRLVSRRYYNEPWQEVTE